MARINIDTLKSAFERGDRPTEQDYINLIDTLAGQATDLGTSGNNELEVTGIENETVIDSFAISEWRIVKYLVSISKTTDGDNKFYATELSVLIDGTNINVAEYGVLDNDGDIGTVSVSRNGNTFELKVVPNPNVKPVTARYARMGLKA